MGVLVEEQQLLITQQRRSYAIYSVWNRFKRNKLAVVGLIFVLLIVIFAVLTPWISPYSYTQPNFLDAYQGPTWKHWLGTDSLGRDMLTRILWGLRNACIVGFGAECIELTVGVVVGATAGYFGGILDNVLMRIVDIGYAFPSYLFSIILVITLGHSIFSILIAVATTSWVGMARVVRGQIMKIKQSAFVESARSMGASPRRIIFRYILPNSMGPIVVAVTFGIPTNMMVEASLSVVGLGIQPPTPDLGELIIEAQQAVLSYPYLLIGPAVVFGVTLLSFAVLGDGLREAFDIKGRH